MARDKMLTEVGLKRLIRWIKQTMGPLTKAEYNKTDRKLTIQPRNEITTIVDLKQQFRDMIYPVGTIVHTYQDNNPGTVLGGTWSKIRGRMIVGAGNKYSATATGGSKNYTVYQSNLPNNNFALSDGQHTHVLYWEWGSSQNLTRQPSDNSYMQGAGTRAGTRAAKSSILTSYTSTTADKRTYHQHTFQSLNGNVTREPVDHMPPYLAVYTWRRTA